MNGNITAAGALSVATLASIRGEFTYSSGTLTAGNRYLIYSGTPTGTTLGPLTFNNTENSVTYPTAPTATGKVLLYRPVSPAYTPKNSANESVLHSLIAFGGNNFDALERYQQLYDSTYVYDPSAPIFFRYAKPNTMMIQDEAFVNGKIITEANSYDLFGSPEHSNDPLL